MNLLFSWCAVILLAARAMAADAVSYVVLNDWPVNSLVRISADGQTVTTIADGARGLGLTVDSKGDYIVAAVSKLLRVTPSGSVSIIATAAPDSGWISVTTDSAGSFLVVDNRQHVLWRISPNGFVERLSSYPVRNSSEWNDAGIIPDGAGGHLLSFANGGNHFFRIAGGIVSEIPLRGKPSAGGGHLVLDGAGMYLIASPPKELHRVAPSGQAELFAVLPGYPCGLARNPETGEIVVVLNFTKALVRVSYDGKRVETLLSGPRYLPSPVDVIAERR